MSRKEGLREDIAQAAAQLNKVTRFNLKRPLHSIERHLLPGEYVIDLTKAVHRGQYGALIRTAQRLLFVVDTMTQRESVSIDLGSVASVRWTFTPGNALLRFTADAKRMKFRHVPRGFADGLQAALVSPSSRQA